MGTCAQCGTQTEDLRFDHAGRMVCQSCGIAQDNADAARAIGNPSSGGGYYSGGGGMEYRMIRFMISICLIFVAVAFRMCAHSHY